ncbi:hypothetical protein HXX76_008952 [Chlamydomonas incerta]|uniref:Uncharacterized protein n=1 Tax=Chlamydomonas incerta TaxID=51695 RepID=A0A835VX59_CHLIN|nr:hypothetical protein HXX76_008952 [Chlamydomonas incerta]|eukprot:KAG2432612.1 hypothetical protein HXX76_008952 [Chlamydomonas incerta]
MCVVQGQIKSLDSQLVRVERLLRTATDAQAKIEDMTRSGDPGVTIAVGTTGVSAEEESGEELESEVEGASDMFVSESESEDEL